MELLSNEILSFVRRSSSGGSNSRRTSPRGSPTATANDQASFQLPAQHADATALVFARRILLGSTRTVSGGDAYDAVEWFFGNKQSSVMICLDPSQSDAVSISLYDAPVRVPPTSHGVGSGSGGGGRSRGATRPAADDFSMYVRKKKGAATFNVAGSSSHPPHPSG